MGNKNKGKNESEIVYEYNIPDLNKSKLKNEYKIVFIGESGTGAKTNLINRLSGKKYNEEEQSTIGSSFSNIKIKLGKNKETYFHLWDTIGQEKFRHLTKLFLTDLDCAVIGYDITNRKNFEEAKNYWYPLIKDEFKPCKVIYFIANKIDLLVNEQVTREEGINFAEKENLRFCAISCKTDEGIREFFDDLVHNLLE